MAKKKESGPQDEWAKALSELASHSIEELNQLIKTVGATGSVDAAVDRAARFLPTSHTDYHGDDHSDFHGDNHGDQHFDAAVIPQGPVEG